MRTPTAVNAYRLVRCLSLRFLAGLGRSVTLLLAEAVPNAVDLPGPQRERETPRPDRAGPPMHAALSATSPASSTGTSPAR